ncbi:hypothetical protein [Treponema phagedenis]|uniref:hypothetical protein n=1 Tax=Treponema phagedenis TaxID=162 RepID=UPI000463F4B3|nr:hypothetical protein [Treponema phagedenis]
MAYTNEALGKALEDLTIAYNNFLTTLKGQVVATISDTVIAGIKQDARKHITHELSEQKAALERAIEAAKEAMDKSAAEVGKKFNDEVEEKRQTIADLLEKAKEALDTKVAATVQVIDNKVSGLKNEIQQTITKKVTSEVQGLKKEFITLDALAGQGDYTDKDPQKGLGVVKTTNRTPNMAECEKNEPWAASPNWVYNLLLGNCSGDVNAKITEAVREKIKSDNNCFYYRKQIYESEIDSTILSGMYPVIYNNYTGALLVFWVGGSVGVVQFLKNYYGGNENWQFRNAIDDDTSRWTPWRTFAATDNLPTKASNDKLGLVKTVSGTPEISDTALGSEYAATPQWVYTLLSRYGSDAIDERVTSAIRNRSGVDHMFIALFQNTVYLQSWSLFGGYALTPDKIFNFPGYRWKNTGAQLESAKNTITKTLNFHCWKLEKIER